MNRPCDQLLSAAAFPLDQDGKRRARRPGDRLSQRASRVAFPKQVVGDLSGSDGGTIEERGSMLRAHAPFGVEATGARWHADGVTLISSERDPFAVELRNQRATASVVCVMDVPGGVCIASWSV